MVGRRSLPSDADDDAQRLRTYVLQCTSRDIVAACQAVEAQLQNVGGENVRDFYRLCFPILLRKIFGFEDSHVSSQPSSSAGGWLAQASVPGNDAAARALISLLSPRGLLFSSLLAADKEHFVRYVFPTERLPEWVRRLLSLDKGANMLCQVSVLFKNRIIEDATGCMQVHLDVFEYYMFWFAYYAVCKDPNSSQGAGGGRRSRSTASRSAQLRTQFEHWASSIPRLHHSPQTSGSSGSPFLQLLKLYLSHFVVLGSSSKGNSGSSGGWSLCLPDNGGVSHGDILLYTLIEFWLVDDDPSPLPLAIGQSLGLQPAGGSTAVLSYIPPGSDLTDSLKVLFKFLNTNLRLSIREHLVTQRSSLATDPGLTYRRKPSETGSGIFASPITTVPGGSSFPSPLSAYSQGSQRPLYRFLLRAFRLWPMGTSVRKISQVVDVWLEYLEPWNASWDGGNVRQQMQLHWTKDVDSRRIGESPQGTLSLSPIVPQKQGEVNGGGGGLGPRVSDRGAATEVYGEQWQGYVLANFLFYTSLVTHFLEFALKFIHIDPEAIFQMTFKILNVIARSKELLDLLQKVDVAYAGHLYGRPHQRNNALVELAPTIQEQLQDWEEGTGLNCEQDPVEGLLHSSSLRGKVPHLRLFSMSDNGGNRLLQAGLSPLSLQQLDNQTGGPAPRPLGLGLQRHSWADVKYRGDWMRRPIESTEVAWLARLLVRLSDSMNAALGITPLRVVTNIDGSSSGPEAVHTEADNAEPIEVEVPSSQSAEIHLSDVVDLLKHMLLHILSVVQQEARNRGWRVNLRFMAEKQFLLLLALVLLLYWAICSIASCITSLTRK